MANKASIVAAMAMAAAVSMAWGSAPALAQPSGEAAYAEACASCHRTPSRFMRRYLDMPEAQRRTELDRVLTDHYAPDPATRAAIVAWLVQNHSRR